MKKIMIIDDEKSSLLLMKAILATHGYDVVTEDDSRKAFATVKANKPDLILMDIVMPEVNGVELAMKIEEDPALKDVHIFAITGMPMLNDHNKKFFEHIIHKPFHADQLLKMINEFFMVNKK